MPEQKHDPEPVLNDDTSNIVVVDGIPICGADKYQKLCDKLRQIFDSFGKIIADGFYVPMQGEPKMTSGYCFVEYATPEEAKAAKLGGDLKKFDAKHTFRVNLLSDFDTIMKTPEKFEPPKKSDFESKAITTQSWMLDDFGRDQFVVRYGTETQIFWHDPIRKHSELGRELKYGGEREKARSKVWTERKVKWSPKGSYLLTYHQPGVVIWGGDQFELLARLKHQDVKHVEFSPSEKYAITCTENNPEAIITWETRTGRKLRPFEKGALFRWSHDDKYFARVGTDARLGAVISVYETPSMVMLEKKSIPIPNVREFLWSPTQSIFSYYSLNDKQPCHITLMEIPSKAVIRDLSLYDVEKVRMLWQDQGDYMAALVARKKGKKLLHSVHVFRVKQKDVPVEIIELEESVTDIAWQPKGHLLVIMHGENTRQHISFYNMKGTGAKIKLMRKVENRPVNSIFWSPAGNTVLLVGFGAPHHGTLEFVSLDSFEAVTAAHHSCNHVEWDPTGRYVVTAVTQPLEDGMSYKHASESGYKTWTFQGNLLHTIPLSDTCFQVHWRPRPAVLSRSDLENLRLQIKPKYWTRYEREDEDLRQYTMDEVQRARREIKLDWLAFRKRKQEEAAAEEESRRSLWAGRDLQSTDEVEEVETWVEGEELSRREEVVTAEELAAAPAPAPVAEETAAQDE